MLGPRTRAAYWWWGWRTRVCGSERPHWPCGLLDSGQTRQFIHCSQGPPHGCHAMSPAGRDSADPHPSVRLPSRLKKGLWEAASLKRSTILPAGTAASSSALKGRYIASLSCFSFSAAGDSPQQLRCEVAPPGQTPDSCWSSHFQRGTILTQKRKMVSE